MKNKNKKNNVKFLFKKRKIIELKIKTKKSQKTFATNINKLILQKKRKKRKNIFVIVANKFVNQEQKQKKQR